MDSDDLALIILIVGLGLGVAWYLEPRRNRDPLAHAAAWHYDVSRSEEGLGAMGDSPRGRSLPEIEAREERKRESVAELALIAPSPEMIREVMALEDEESGDAETPPTSPIDQVHATSPNL